jgi:cyanophycin synthetase
MSQTAPVIQANKSWSQFPGVAYGLTQPALIGGVTVRMPPGFRFDALDRVIAAVAEEIRLPPVEAEGAAGLVERALHWATEIQIYANISVSRRFYVGPPVSAEGERTAFRVGLPCLAHEATRQCLGWALTALNRILAAQAADPEAPVDLAGDLAGLRTALKKHSQPGLNAFHFLQAAHRLEIPARRVLANLYAFGTGRYIRYLESSITDSTPHMGVRIAHDKLATAEILRRAGLPAPRHVAVETEDAAVEAAEKLGFPVVVKPIDQEQGRGVAAGLEDLGELRQAFADAKVFSARVIVEKHFHGRDFRLTVLNDRVIKVEERVAGGVTGDGVATVAQLVGRAQQTPRFRRLLRDTGKLVMDLDAEALAMLARAGLGPDSVPAAGAYVPLRRKNNVSAGGEQIATPVGGVHPDNLALAVRAARLLGLDMAGIDLLTPDPARSWMDTGALICEVNAQPQIGVKTTPEIYVEILATLMQRGHRIPAHLALTADPDALPFDAAVALADELGCNGLSLAGGVWIDGERLAGRPTNAFQAAAILLGEPTAEGALCVLPLGEALKLGLPTDRFASLRLIGLAQSPHHSQRDALRLALGPHAEHYLECD